MEKKFPEEFSVDHIEIYTPMAKVLSYWHEHALGFSLSAYANNETGEQNLSSYVLTSKNIRLVLTGTYPVANTAANADVSLFIAQHFCGVKKICLHVADVEAVFNRCISNGGVPVKAPCKKEDASGYIEEASVKLYDDCEIVFVNRSNYCGVFKPGYKASGSPAYHEPLLENIDHIASELRVNESKFWSSYLNNILGTSLVQTFGESEENKTGMILNINQSRNGSLTLVIAEPTSCSPTSKVQRNISEFGPGIHHLAFSTEDLVQTTRLLLERGVDFVTFPASYYELLRVNEDFKDVDIDSLQKNNILIDKEGETYLLQKFIKPISDRPFFIYEIVQRINGYNGFALKNINILKRAEELQIMEVKPA